MYQLFEEGGFAVKVCLGYMQILRGKVMEELGWNPDMTNPLEAKIINTHPGILPATKDTHGSDTSQRVLDLRLSHTAHTVHVVAPGVDEGPKLYEHLVPVKDDDTAETLFGRVQIAEKAAMPLIISAFLRQQKLFKEGKL